MAARSARRYTAADTCITRRHTHCRVNGHDTRNDDRQSITFRVSRRRREVYIGHARLSVCPSPQSHTTPRTRV